MNWQIYFIEFSYLLASILFILGLKGLSHPETAKRGMHLAEFGMLMAIIGTLMHFEIVSYTWIIVGLLLGSTLGAAMGVWVPMTAMPQRTALSHAFGAFAAALVGIAEYYSYTHGFKPLADLGHVKMGAMGFEIMLGSLTTTGSLIAFGKLQGIVPGKPLVYRGQNIFNMTLLAVTIGLFIYLIFVPTAVIPFYVMLALAFVFGVLLVLPIGSADMPVVISLLNSYAGLASSATGFVLGNNVLIIAGALDGASGFLLSVLMSRAMNRSFTNVLFGAFGGGERAAATLRAAGEKTVRPITAEDAAIQLAYARLVIVVPGYGMAVAQAQHQVAELAEMIEKRGGTVKYAIHPVAGRMPGHMNVLLAEANVPYDRLYDMEDINPEFENADVALVIGANDVVNPAARNEPASPIYGMPILDVDRAKSIIVLKRSMNPGFAGIENELFYHPKCSMLFGNAKDSLVKLIGGIKN